MRTGAVPIIVNSYEFIFSAEFDDPFFDRKNSAEFSPISRLNSAEFTWIHQKSSKKRPLRMTLTAMGLKSQFKKCDDHIHLYPDVYKYPYTRTRRFITGLNFDYSTAYSIQSYSTNSIAVCWLSTDYLVKRTNWVTEASIWHPFYCQWYRQDDGVERNGGFHGRANGIHYIQAETFVKMQSLWQDFLDTEIVRTTSPWKDAHRRTTFRMPWDRLQQTFLQER
jgi:hypothetical protein